MRLDTGVMLPLVPTEMAFRGRYALEGHKIWLEQQCSNLIDVELPLHTC